MADFIVSPNVGDEIAKEKNRYKFDGVGWTPVTRPQSQSGTLLVTSSSWVFTLTLGQTAITGADTNSITLSYDTAAEITIYYNGVNAMFVLDFIKHERKQLSHPNKYGDSFRWIVFA